MGCLLCREVIVSERYSLSADIYSFGVILWEICEAAAPFADLAPGRVPLAVVQEKKRPRLSSTTPQVRSVPSCVVYAMIRTGAYCMDDEPTASVASQALQTLIRACWQEDAASRPTAAATVHVLQSFFPSA